MQIRSGTWSGSGYDALTVIFSGGQMATNATTAVALDTTEERLIVRWLAIKKTGSV